MWWSMEIIARYFIMIFMRADPCSIACLALVFQNHAAHTLVVLHRHGAISSRDGKGRPAGSRKGV